MSDKIDFGGKPWQAIPRDILRDPRLSPQAKGGLVTLLSHDEGWVRSALAVLQKENACGRDRARAIMRELVDTGYVEAEQTRVGGQFKTRYVIRTDRHTASGSPTRRIGGKNTPKSSVHRIGETGDGSTASVNPPPVVEPTDVDTQDGDPITPKAKAAPAGADVDNVRQIVVSDRWPYFLEKLAAQDDAWKRMTIGACVRIAKATSDGDVTTALSFAAERAPILTGSAYGWLEATSRGLMEARQESA